MLKKIIIEKDDEQKMMEWDKERLKNFVAMVTPFEEDLENTYVISLDVADKDSEDRSVMIWFKVVDGEYIFEKCEDL